jgi:NADH dehydrogenase
MKKFVLPKDYPELDFSQMEITLIEASDRLLAICRNNHQPKQSGT